MTGESPDPQTFLFFVKVAQVAVLILLLILILIFLMVRHLRWVPHLPHGLHRMLIESTRTRMRKPVQVQDEEKD